MELSKILLLWTKYLVQNRSSHSVKNFIPPYLYASFCFWKTHNILKLYWDFVNCSICRLTHWKSNILVHTCICCHFKVRYLESNPNLLLTLYVCMFVSRISPGQDWSYKLPTKHQPTTNHNPLATTKQPPLKVQGKGTSPPLHVLNSYLTMYISTL